MRPDARQEQLLIEEVGEDLVVYDLQRHRVHQLNRTAALVWRNCNGRKTVADLTKVLQHELNPAVDESLVRKALDQLGKARLLQEALPRSAGLTRRQALGKFGRVAALAILAPAVTSITAPTPLRAQPVFSCNSFTCAQDICRPLCTGDFPASCSQFMPFCRLQPCNQPSCPGCLQLQCTTSPSNAQPTTGRVARRRG